MVQKTIIRKRLGNLLAAKKRSCFDVTIFSSLLILLARFCTPLEVKFHVFRWLKRREEKSISKIFFVVVVV